ncbi:MAG: phospholipid carrier-dependent glycosyltransferase [Myxococcales bacterium]|nr:phospholipid carrier-dependent glycosyltransferase [Myxococcales bacterium]
MTNLAQSNTKRQALARALSAPALPLVTACVGMIALGYWLRAQRLGVPAVLTWDEHHFVNNARNYLEGRPDLNDHPPLGKLLMALPMHYLGDTAVAWRLAPLLLGCTSVLLIGVLAGWAARRREAFWIGAAFAALDGFLLTYSRTALLDGMLTCLALATVIAAACFRSPIGVGVAALLLGSACSVKFSAVVLVPIVVWAALSKRAWLWSSLSLVLAPAAYVGWYMLGLRMAKQPAGMASVISETKRLYVHHAGLTDWKHPLLSHWYEWFLPTRPLPIRSETMSDGRLQLMHSLGNPLLWWMVDAALVVSVVFIVRAAWRSARAQGVKPALVAFPGWFDSPSGRWLVLLLAWCGPVLPWIVSKRDSYIYHYLPAYAFGIALAATLVARVYHRRHTLGLCAVLVVGQVSFYYAPIWSQRPLSAQGVRGRLFLHTWR